MLCFFKFQIPHHLLSLHKTHPMPFTFILMRLEKALPQAEKVNLKVSQREAGWHLEHSLKIIKSICDTLIASNPKDYKPKFNIRKFYILWLNRIPRGKGRSPKPFNNKEEIDQAALQQHYENAKIALRGIQHLDKHTHFRHPIFGNLKYKDAKKFIKIHTRHHLDIIDDILKA
jgi:hypothetical protein